jgi:hypothetical protein
VVDGENWGKDDRKQNTLVPLELSIELIVTETFACDTEMPLSKKYKE